MQVYNHLLLTWVCSRVQTFQEGDTAGDGVISREEWHALVNENPGVINYMTLDALRELTTKYPSFLTIPRA